MTFPALMLQKPSAKSKTRDHISCLQRRLELWGRGEIAELLKEGTAIQRILHLSSQRRDSEDESKQACKFAKLMMEGKVRAALRLLTKQAKSGLLRLDQVIGGYSSTAGRTVREILEEKHPNASPVHADAILCDDPTNDDFHPIVFDGITSEVIRVSALHTEGSAGPSGVDAMSWRRLCTAFGQKSNDLCSALAAFARSICTTYVDLSGLTAYTSCRLVPLDKCPGVRPVGIGEVVRRIIGKAVMRTVKHDLQDAVGTIQLCAGQVAGCEAAVHAMRHIFAEDELKLLFLWMPQMHSIG